MRPAIGLIALSLIVASVGFAQGPLVLMGIDAEDGNGQFGSQHGGKVPYTSVLMSILTNVTNGGSGVLVIGGGKSATDDVTAFWSAVSSGASQTATHVNGATNITNQSFAGFAVIAVASSAFETFSGGVTDAENNALTARAGDIANFVNGGGGLFGLSQSGLTTPYGYLGSIGAFTFAFPAQYSDVTATAAGMAVGITNTNLDVCCWHDEYLTFPGFLEVLATNNITGRAAAIGGAQVIIVQGIVLTPLNATNNVGTSHMVTATVADNFGVPVVGTMVTFNVIAGPNTGQMGGGITNAAGQATFTYMGNGGPGADTIEACFIDSTQMQLCAQANKQWIVVGGFEGCTPGFWKNHPSAWAATGLNPSDQIDTVFMGSLFGTSSLHDALGFGGGKGTVGAQQILLRAAVAALLNASDPGVNYTMSAGQVIASVEAALASNDRATMLGLATDLDNDNNLGCPH